jgi:hydroxymethylpyrimidine/phosphomethylpyrimidine kinase
VKGGHLGQSDDARDVFFDGKVEEVLSARFVKGVRTHGTGCVYSAAICAALARGKKLVEAVHAAKHFVTQAILNSYRTGKHCQLGVQSGLKNTVAIRG